MRENETMALDREFQQYFKSLERAGNEDRCFLCRRSPADVKTFFGFHEDGTPIDADRYGIEDVVIDPKLDIMSYNGTRPVCAVCQLNHDTIRMANNGSQVLRTVLRELEFDSERLWGREMRSEDSQPDPKPSGSVPL